jgi:hypothetical protein
MVILFITFQLCDDTNVYGVTGVDKAIVINGAQC